MNLCTNRQLHRSDGPDIQEITDKWAERLNTPIGYSCP